MMKTFVLKREEEEKRNISAWHLQARGGDGRRWEDFFLTSSSFLPSFRRSKNLVFTWLARPS